MGYSIKKYLDLPVIIAFLAILATGVFHAFLSCLLTAALVICLLLAWRREKKIRFRWNLASAAVWVMVLFYLVGALWAVDPGEAWIGFVKYLPLAFFLLLLFQQPETKGKFFVVLPYFAAAVTIISGALMQVPALAPYFSVSGRLAGVFQYPNTFACFLLIAELTLCSGMVSAGRRGKRLLLDLVVVLVLVAGMLYSGSRTVLVLAYISNLVLLLYLENRKGRVITAVAAGVILAAVVAIALIRQQADPAGTSVFRIAGTTLADRLLYYRDAVPMILKRPFGAGYLGYYFLQGGYRTGVYHTLFVHNGFLQVFLDAGWIPGILLIAAIVKAVVSKALKIPEKVILLTFAVHIFFDFDLQFVGMFMILLMMLDFGAGKERIAGRTGTLTARILAILLGAVSIYMAIPLLLSAFHANKPAQALYPWNTENQLEMLQASADLEETQAIAGEILQHNPYAAAAWDSMAKVYYSQGDFGNVIACERKALELGRFEHDYYVDYMKMLLTGQQLYMQAGDESSAGVCRETLLNVYDAFRSQEDQLSGLGKILKDQPDLTLPEDLEQSINILLATN